MCVTSLASGVFISEQPKVVWGGDGQGGSLRTRQTSFFVVEDFQPLRRQIVSAFSALYHAPSLFGLLFCPVSARVKIRGGECVTASSAMFAELGSFCRDVKCFHFDITQSYFTLKK